MSDTNYFEYDDYYSYPPRKKMNFSDLSVGDKVRYTKQEFTTIVKSIFENPEQLKPMITEKRLSSAQAKAVLKSIQALNANSCACCRRFDPKKLVTSPIEDNLLPLLDMAQSNVKSRSY